MNPVHPPSPPVTPLPRRLRKEAKIFLKDARKLLKRGRKRLAPRPLQKIEAGLAGLQEALNAKDGQRVSNYLDELSPMLDEHLAFARKSTAREYAESIGVAIAVALLLRFFVVEAFKIPSGSMVPTLVVGDHIFVNKFIYGIRVPLTEKWLVHFKEPSRGDVIVFMYPEDRDKDFIKRVVGIPGDTVSLVDGKLQVTDEAGQAVSIEQETTNPAFHYVEEGEASRGLEVLSVEMEERIAGQPHSILYRKDGRGMRNFGPVTIRPDHVFVMGDNRDNSHDSRFWGQVPYDLIKGKALIIWYSGRHLGRVGKLVD